MAAAGEADEHAGSPALCLRELAARSDIPPLCARLYFLAYDNPPGVVICDVSGASQNFIVVEALLRLQLTARRLGWTILIRNACGDLRQLLTLTGLDEALTVDNSDGRKPEHRKPDPTNRSVGWACRQAEEGEPPSGVEEGVEPDDLAP